MNSSLVTPDELHATPSSNDWSDVRLESLPPKHQRTVHLDDVIEEDARMRQTKGRWRAQRDLEMFVNYSRADSIASQLTSSMFALSDVPELSSEC